MQPTDTSSSATIAAQLVLSERAIEKRIEQEPKLAKSELIGRARRIDDDHVRIARALV